MKEQIAQLRGDLDWIVMKCLEKDRTRRYETANGLAFDLKRHLNNEPVLARPPSAAYKFQKAFRRNRLMFTAVTAVVAALAAGIAVSMWQTVQARKAQRQAQIATELVLSEKREAAAQEAILAARGGETAAAEAAIDRAEALGLPPGQVHMLRGQLNLQELRPDEAIRDLEQAVRLLPGSVAAKALLTLACYDAGENDRGDKLTEELEKMPPQTPEDFLFKGQVGSDPRLSLRTIDAGVRLKDWVLARLIRAKARSAYATDTGDPSDTIGAVEDAEAARAMLPSSPDALATSLEVHVFRAYMLGLKNQTVEREQELKHAARDAQTLEHVKNSRVACARAFYFWELGDEAASLRELRRSVESNGGAYALHTCVAALFGAGRFSEALSILDRQPHSGGPDCAWLRSYVLTEVPPNGPAKALQAIQRSGIDAGESIVPLLGLTVRQLTGHPEEARHLAQALHNRIHSSARNHWFERVFEFESGILAEDQLLRMAGSSQWCLCEAHYYIGLEHLSRGDKLRAQEHFRQSAATPVYEFYEHAWSRAFLKRMEADPNWPSWIPLKEAAH